MRKSVLIAAVVTAAVALSGVRIYADDANDIETAYSFNSYVQYDNYGLGNDPSGFPVITSVASYPSSFAGHTFTGWTVFAQDQSGSLNLFVSQFTLTNIAGHNVSSLAVGDGVNSAGQWGPFHQIPELSYSTVPASNNYFTVTSHGNTVPAAPVTTVSHVNVPTLPLDSAGYYLEIMDATISGSTGSYSSVFPGYLSNIAAESYTITDSTGSMTMFDWTTSYAGACALGGTPVPTGPVDIYGFISYNTGGPAEFTPLLIIPEPSTIMLAGLGLAGLLAIRRRRS